MITGGGEKMEYKGIGIRAVAQIVDGIIFFVLFLLIGFLVTGSFTFQLAGASAMMLTGAMSLIGFLYFTLLEGTKGQTVGKMVTGIKVVKEDGQPCGMASSLIRNLLRIIDGIFVYVVGAIIVAQSDRNQRLGDKVGDTVVIDA